MDVQGPTKAVEYPEEATDKEVSDYDSAEDDPLDLRLYGAMPALTDIDTDSDNSSDEESDEETEMDEDAREDTDMDEDEGGVFPPGAPSVAGPACLTPGEIMLLVLDWM